MRLFFCTTRNVRAIHLLIFLLVKKRRWVNDVLIHGSKHKLFIWLKAGAIYLFKPTTQFNLNYQTRQFKTFTLFPILRTLILIPYLSIISLKLSIFYIGISCSAKKCIQVTLNSTERSESPLCSLFHFSMVINFGCLLLFWIVRQFSLWSSKF